MAGESSMALDDLLRKTQLSDDVDFLREGGARWRRRSWRWKCPSTWARAGTSAAPSGRVNAMAYASGVGTRGWGA